MTDKEYQHALYLMEKGIRADEREKMIDECIALFREWQPRLATNISKFGDALQQLKEQTND